MMPKLGTVKSGKLTKQRRNKNIPPSMNKPKGAMVINAIHIECHDGDIRKLTPKRMKEHIRDIRPGARIPGVTIAKHNKLLAHA